MSTSPSPRSSVAAWPTTPRRSETGSAIALIVIGLAREDLVGAVELLHEDHARELVRERHRAERELEVTAVELESLRPPDDEAEVAPLLTPLLEPAAEADRVVGLALAREQD